MLQPLWKNHYNKSPIGVWTDFLYFINYLVNYKSPQKGLLVFNWLFTGLILLGFVKSWISVFFSFFNLWKKNHSVLIPSITILLPYTKEIDSKFSAKCVKYASRWTKKMRRRPCKYFTGFYYETVIGQYKYVEKMY